MTLPRVQLFFFRWKQSVFPMSLICKPLRNKQQPKKTTLLSLWPHFALGVEFDLRRSSVQGRLHVYVGRRESLLRTIAQLIWISS